MIKKILYNIKSGVRHNRIDIKPIKGFVIKEGTVINKMFIHTKIIKSKVTLHTHTKSVTLSWLNNCTDFYEMHAWRFFHS